VTPYVQPKQLSPNLPHNAAELIASIPDDLSIPRVLEAK
jgi:hypothetical protein